jgi:hypothetical protein
VDWDYEIYPSHRDHKSEMKGSFGDLSVEGKRDIK